MPGMAFQSARRARAGALLLAALLGCSSTHTSTTSKTGKSSPFGNAGTSGSTSTLGKNRLGTTPASPTGEGYESCSNIGSTRACCSSGTQTCSGAPEFASWGPCLDANGVVLQCGGTNDGCANSEFGCGGGTGGGGGGNTPPGNNPPPGDNCANAEFGCSGNQPPPGPPPPPGGSYCSDKTINNEPEILAAYSPAPGQAVGKDGLIRVWITDEAPALIGPGEQIDPATGEISVPGDHTSRAPDGLLWEPALYIAPQTVERGGTPHFPRYIGGWYNSVPPVGGRKPAAGAGSQGPAIQTPPAGTRLSEKFNTEDVWEVSDLGLAPGTYDAEFVILDGDLNRAIGCVTIVIAP